MTLLVRLLLPIALAFPAPIAAQSQPTEPKPAEEILTRLPASLFEGPAVRTPNSTLVTYFPKDIGRSPIAGVLAIETTTIPSMDEMRVSAREAFHASGLKRVLQETGFTSPAYPGGFGFFGEYETDIGLKQSWTLETGKYRIHTTVTLFTHKDRERAITVNADQIYGGAQFAPVEK
jgi:hypothetical protein